MGYESPKLMSSSKPPTKPSTLDANPKLVRPVTLQTDNVSLFFIQDGSTIAYASDLEDFLNKSANYPILFDLEPSLAPFISPLSTHQLLLKLNELKTDTRPHASTVSHLIDVEYKTRLTETADWWQSLSMEDRTSHMRQLAYSETWSNTPWENMTPAIQRDITNFYWTNRLGGI